MQSKWVDNWTERAIESERYAVTYEVYEAWSDYALSSIDWRPSNRILTPYTSFER